MNLRQMAAALDVPAITLHRWQRDGITRFAGGDPGMPYRVDATEEAVCRVLVKLATFGVGSEVLRAAAGGVRQAHSDGFGTLGRRWLVLTRLPLCYPEGAKMGGWATWTATDTEAVEAEGHRLLVELPWTT